MTGEFDARGLQHLSRCPSLAMLVFQRSGVTDDDLAALEKTKLPELEIIALNDTSITDASVARIAHFPKLHTVFLHNTQVTDSCLASLQQFPSLRCVSLDGTRIHAATIEAFSREHNVQIVE